MKPTEVTAVLSLAASLVQALAVPGGPAGDGADTLLLTPRFRPSYKTQAARDELGAGFAERLFRRKGGGGGGSRGGGSSGGSSGGGSSSGGSSSGGSSSGGSSSGSSGSSGSSSGSSSGRGGSSSSGSSSSGSSGSGSSSSSSSSGKGGSSSSGKGLGSSSSNSGGRTTTGSGPARSYGGGSYYGGGANTPYRSGAPSPSGILPLGIGLAAGSAIAFWPGHWYHPIYYYPYSHPYSYYNASSGRNETRPVGCGCDQTVECGCDDNNNSTYMNSVIGNGSYSALNTSLVNVADVNGTTTILINGTLPNGTTASGGSDSPNAAGGMRLLLQHAGWWPAAATMAAMVYLL